MRTAGRWVAGRTAVALAASLAASLAAWACGSLQEESPTQPNPAPPAAAAPSPDPTPNPNPTPTPIFGAPAPKATPTPEPSPGGGGEGGASCGTPTPPPLSQINVKVHLRGGEWLVIDSTPLVGPNAPYCAQIGFTDGRSVCPVRQEGDPSRTACELYVTGRATDTGRPGPTWSLDGAPCTGRASGCENHPENQYQVIAYRSGIYRACGRNGVCGEVTADR